jgi:hypothetical protein
MKGRAFVTHGPCGQDQIAGLKTFNQSAGGTDKNAGFGAQSERFVENGRSERSADARIHECHGYAAVLKKQVGVPAVDIIQYRGAISPFTVPDEVGGETQNAVFWKTKIRCRFLPGPDKISGFENRSLGGIPVQQFDRCHQNLQPMLYQNINIQQFPEGSKENFHISFKNKMYLTFLWKKFKFLQRIHI